MLFQNNEMAAMLVVQTSPLGVSYVKNYFVPICLHRCWTRA